MCNNSYDPLFFNMYHFVTTSVVVEDPSRSVIIACKVGCSPKELSFINRITSNTYRN